MNIKEPVAFTLREIKLLNGMIDVQLYHAEQCQGIIDRPGGNKVMATKQKEYDLERVELLRKILRSNLIPKE